MWHVYLPTTAPVRAFSTRLDSSMGLTGLVSTMKFRKHRTSARIVRFLRPFWSLVFIGDVWLRKWVVECVIFTFFIFQVVITLCWKWKIIYANKSREWVWWTFLKSDTAWPRYSQQYMFLFWTSVHDYVKYQSTFTTRQHAEHDIVLPILSVCLSICPSVCLSHAGIPSKLMHTESYYFYLLIGTLF